VEVDKIWMNMPDEFPSNPRKHNDKFVITVRFPRFNGTVFYDPIVDDTDENVQDGTDPTDGGRAICATFLPLSVGLLLAFAASKFAL